MTNSFPNIENEDDRRETVWDTQDKTEKLSKKRYTN
jgi:hypothetical protein